MECYICGASIRDGEECYLIDFSDITVDGELVARTDMVQACCVSCAEAEEEAM